MAHVRAMTTYLDKALSELAAQKVVIKEVRGLGLMKGIELSVPAAYYINALQEAGIIVISSILTIKMSYMVPEMENTMDLALITRTRITLLLK